MVNEYDSEDLVEFHILQELCKLRKENNYLKSCIRDGADEIKCAVCGAKIDHLSMQRATRPVLWHNRDCFVFKPRKVIGLEKEFGCDIVDVLKETTKRCGNIKAQCQVLGISIPYFYSLIRKYCGENYLDFMSKNASGERKALYESKVKTKT